MGFGPRKEYALQRGPSAKQNARTNLSWATLSLYQAIRAGNLAQVRRLTEQGADVNARDRREYTPLDEAVASETRQTVAIVDYLLKKGANPTMRTKGWTPLHLAAYYGQGRVVALLLSQQGVDINAITWFGATPLHLAVEGIGGRVRQIEVMRVLINIERERIFSDDQDRTPLQVAQQQEGQDAAIRLLTLQTLFVVRGIKILQNRGPCGDKVLVFKLESSTDDANLLTLFFGDPSIACGQFKKNL